jgi:hypothetical protein
MKKNLLFSLAFLGSFNLYAQQTDRCDCFEQGDEPLSACKVVPAYNFPARVEPACPSGFSAEIAFLYWRAGQEGMDLATTAVFSGGVVIPSNTQGQTIFQKSEYAPGFRLGLGFGPHVDGWVFYADYTYFREHTHTVKTAPVSDVGEGVLYLTDWFFQSSTAGQSIAATELSSKWRLGIDWLDLMFKRPFYQGRRVIVSPFAGLRTSWIRQNLRISVNDAVNITPPQQPVISHNNSHSWGIGPRIGVEGRMLIGEGFRLQSTLGASILFTQYTHVSHSEDTFTDGGSSISYAFHDYDCLRAMAEANLGLGWGAYFCQNRYHLDLSATYDFNYLWNQNMMRILNDTNIFGIGGGGNDLYIHGLTLNAGFNF